MFGIVSDVVFDDVHTWYLCQFLDLDFHDVSDKSDRIPSVEGDPDERPRRDR